MGIIQHCPRVNGLILGDIRLLFLDRTNTAGGRGLPLFVRAEPWGAGGQGCLGRF